MKRLIRLVRNHLILTDGIVALGIAAVSAYFNVNLSVEPDIIAIFAALLIAINVVAYAALISISENRPSLSRLKRSSQFRVVLLITFIYPLLTFIVAGACSLLDLKYGSNLAYAMIVVVLIRITWIFYKTIKLF